MRLVALVGLVVGLFGVSAYAMHRTFQEGDESIWAGVSIFSTVPTGLALSRLLYELFWRQ
jgi:hypothetical protein